MANMSFKSWLEGISPPNPQLAAAQRTVAMAAKTAADTGKEDPVTAAKKAGTTAVLSGQAQITDLKKIIPTDDQAQTTQRMMKKK